LRPGHPIESTHLRGDEHCDSLHMGAFLDGELIGTASVAPQSPSGQERLGDWQLTGVGVLEKARKLGCGRKLVQACLGCGRKVVQACLDYVTGKGGDRVWCHARTSALKFYTSMGFQAEGEEFDTPISGPHYFMWRHVSECRPSIEIYEE